MPLRRRREGAAVQARTEEQSSARVRVPVRQKAPRSLRRRRPSRGGVQREISAGTTRREGPPTFTPHRAGDPGARGATRRARAISSKSARFAFARALRPAIRLVRASGTRRTQVGAYGSWLAGPRCGNAPSEADATGIGWCRRVAGRKPHSRARIGRLDRVCPRVVFRLQKSASGAETPRSATPVGNGARGREPGPPESSQGRSGG